MTLDNLKSQLDLNNNFLQRQKGELNYLKKDYEYNLKKIEELNIEDTLHRQAIEVLSQVQTITRDKVKEEIEKLVTYILQFIIEENYQFKLNFDRRGNLQELKFGLINPNGDEILNILEQCGGGICDLISFGLRIILIELNKINGFIICDESFKHLSENYRKKIPFLLKELNNKLHRQFIIISHESELIEEYSFNKIKIGD